MKTQNQNSGHGPHDNGDKKAYPLDSYTVASKSENNAEEKNPYFKSSAPLISLPKGGGALKGIDEKFTVNAVNGTASLQVPLPFTPGRGGFNPAMSLSYNSGSGNGVFGLGWNVDLASIQRKTDKKLPVYDDSVDSDVFLLAGTEDLVPELDGSGNIVPLTSAPYVIKRYRPRIEGLFARIELIRKNGQADCWWKVTTKENIVTYYGLTSEARIADPDNPNRIFKWLPQLSYDKKGNVQVYSYTTDSSSSIVPALIHESNRKNGLASFTNTYINTISWCNDAHYTASNDYQPSLSGMTFRMIAAFDYGNFHPDIPKLSDTFAIPARMDAFSDFHAGFEIRCYRRCRRVLMFHKFSELFTGISSPPSECLVRSLNVEYAYDGATTLKEADYITRITQKGHKLNTDATYLTRSLPAIQLTYQPLAWNSTVQTVSAENFRNAPQGLTGSYQWIDLKGTGLPGILTEQGVAWHYKTNLGDAHFTAAVQVLQKPSFAGLGDAMQWQDLDADGKRQLVSRNMMAGYFELGDDDKWMPFRQFDDLINVDWNSPYTHALDLNGDGRPDLLITEENVWRWYENEGTEGYRNGGYGIAARDEEKGPRMLLNHMAQAIFLADMNGDGMTDIVRIQNGEVCYWPNMGYGKFGAKVTMSNAPLFDMPDRFDPRFLTLADISGTGAPDLIYIGKGKCTAWINLAGNGWSAATDICPLPSVEQFSKISVVDFLGNGTPCIVWSSPLGVHGQAPLRYIDLMGGIKPYLLKKYENSIGKAVEITYKQSTKYYLEDNANNKPWATKLPFPVQCVSQIKTSDTVSNTSYSQQYSYHHGYYDHEEREFRGFGRVEVIDTDIAYASDAALTNGTTSSDDLNQFPVKTVSWYHTGAFIRHKTLIDAYSAEYTPKTFPTLPTAPDMPAGLTAQEQREAYRALKGQLLRQEIYALDGVSAMPYTVTSHAYAVKLIQPAKGNRFASFISYQQHNLVFSCERNITDPRIIHELTLETDIYGNVTKSAKVCYPRAITPGSLPAVVVATQQKMLCTYTENKLTNDVITPVTYRLRALYETKTYEITGLTIASGTLWTVSSLNDRINGNSGLSIPAASEINFTASPSTASTPPAEKRAVNTSRILYQNDAVGSTLNLGIIDSLAIPYQEYHQVISADMLSDAAWYNNLITNPAVMLTAEGGLLCEADITPFASSVTSRYWLPGGTVTYDNAHFYTPTAYTDPWGKTTAVTYWNTGSINYYLLPQTVTDALGNVTTVNAYNWYNLQPSMLTDPNNNISEALYDVLGMAVAVALKGKGTEGDTIGTLDPNPSDAILNTFFTDPVLKAATMLGSATWRCVYDLRTAPVKVAMIGREIHDANVGSANPLLLRVTYTDGLGRLAMHKIQAAPSEGSSTIRWIGNGKTVYNNKGNAVMQYEPFFSTIGPAYDDAEAAAAVGVTSRVHYDALGRAVRTDMPDGSFTSTQWDAWVQTIRDNNDNVEGSLWQTLHSASGDTSETDAVNKALKHKDTPTTIYLDTLARAFYTRQHNKLPDSTGVWNDEFYESYVVLDIDGSRKAVVDARGITVLAYTYNMLKAPVRQISVDSGTQRILTDAANQPLYAWDAEGNRFRHTYDDLRRVLSKEVLTASAATKILEVNMYGEATSSPATHNLRTRIYKIYDGAGSQKIPDYDFKGNPLATERTFAASATTRPDWTSANIAAPSYLETDTYVTVMTYDALNRPLTIVAPDSGITTYTYDKSGLLFSVRVDNVGSHGASSPTYSLATEIIKQIYYNEKGQRLKAKFANGTTTTYLYDYQTFRLKEIRTTRNSDSAILQYLGYYYDPIGNITMYLDLADQNKIINGPTGMPDFSYTYDALYRLIKSVGRERIGSNAASNYNDSDKKEPIFRIPNGNIQTYIQYYSYDEVGNMKEMKHTAGTSFPNRWTRTFEVEKTIGGSPVPINNRLHSSTVSSSTETYTYDLRGNMTGGMNHLSGMVYNEENRLESVVVTGSITTYYQYDNSGQRVRKHIVNTASHTAKTRKYIGLWEYYKEYDTATNITSLERETFHIMDDQNRIALIDTPITVPSGSGEVQLLRYQYGNNLGSATLELDDAAAIISYEEYYPFGSTAVQGGRSTAEVSLKRYRYTGKERDEETGFYYNKARYHCPWLTRWTTVDPLESQFSPSSPYNYSNCNPIRFNDPSGRGGEDVVDNSTWTTPGGGNISVPNATALFIDNEGHEMTLSGGEKIPIVGKDVLLGFSDATGEYHAFFEKPNSDGPWVFAGYKNQLGQIYDDGGSKNQEGNLAANAAINISDANKRIKYETANEVNAAEGVAKVNAAETVGDLPAAEIAAKTAHFQRSEGRITTQNEMSPGSRVFSRKIDPPGKPSWETSFNKYKSENPFDTYRNIAEGSGRSHMQGRGIFKNFPKFKPLKAIAQASRVMAAAAIVFELKTIYDVATEAPEGQKLNAVTREVFSVLTGFLAAVAVAAMVAAILPAAASLLGFLAINAAGGIAGYYGSEAGKQIYDHK